MSVESGPAASSFPSGGANGSGAATTSFICHHLPQHRYVSTCGWVEGCRACRAVRWTAEHGVPQGFWPAEVRREVRDGTECRSYDREGRLVARRPRGSSVTPL